MKKSKIISLLLVVTMLVTLMGISVSAEDTLSYTAKGTYEVTADQTLNPENFNVTVEVRSKYACRDQRIPVGN